MYSDNQNDKGKITIIPRDDDSGPDTFPGYATQRRRAAGAEKPPERRGRVLFIKAVTRERAQSFLRPAHQERILQAYRDFGPLTAGEAFARAASQDEIAAQGYSLSIPLYVWFVG